MDAGKLRHYVELQRRTTTLDRHGDQVQEWATIGRAWASIEQLSGREFMAATQAMSDITVRIRIRARLDLALTPKDRVRYGARTFDIRHIADWGDRGVEHQLLCVERYD